MLWLILWEDWGREAKLASGSGGLSLIEWSSYLNLVKQYGPVIAALLVLIWWQWRQIEKLLERNAAIYESHIKSLYETQGRLLDKLIGPQPSSQSAPTIKDLASSANGGKDAGAAAQEAK